MLLKEVKFIKHTANFSNFIKEFENYKEFFKKNIVPFNDKILDLYKRYNILTSTTFKKYTYLSTYQYNRLKKPNHKPALSTLVSVVYGLQQDISILHILCESLDVKINYRDDTVCAYAFIIERYRGYDIIEANKLLTILGVNRKDLLGSPEARKIALEELAVDMPHVFDSIKK